MSSSPPPEQDLENLIKLSQLMLDAAKAGLWEEVSRLEESRKILLTDFFSAPVTVSGNSVTSTIRFILGSDREVMRLGSMERDDLRSALKRISRGKGAVKAYRAV